MSAEQKKDSTTLLDEHVKNGRDWEKLKTEVEGVFIVKIPQTKQRPALLMVEVNPLRDGKPIKRKGFFVTDNDLREAMIEALQDERVAALVDKVDSFNAPILSKADKVLKIAD